LGFSFLQAVLAEGFLMVRSLIGIRRVCFSAVAALMLVCAWVPANAGQSSTGDTAKPATTTTTPRKVSATSSSSSAAKTANKTHTASTGKRSRRKSAKTRGQQKIDSERAQAIQEALIREHYLTGEATGKWNESSEAAMRKYQADHGWQSKTVPDSRALISLGLGPSKDHLLNPESAMTSVPDAPHAASRSTNPPADAAAPSSNPSDPRRPQ
jgi:peptidoglycan hydrolase-like protein with peptidoglycan-binding domain